MTKSNTVIDPNNPGATAELFHAAHRPTLIHHKDEWFVWDSAAYRVVDDDTIESQIRTFLESCNVRFLKEKGGETAVELKPFRPRRKDVEEVYRALKNHHHVPPETMAPPCWLRDAPEEYAALDPSKMISCKNGLLEIKTRNLHPATSKFFTHTSLDIEFDPEAPKPERFLRFLNEVTLGRQPLVDLLQEMFGYIISGDTSHQKVFFLRGKPRSGKGTILRTLEELVGKHNIATPTIRNLSSQFGMQSLIGKPLAAISDMNTDNRAALSEAGSIINGISGEDSQTIPRKFHGDWVGKMSARFLLISNRMPNFGSNADALATRFLIVPFDVSFKGREDYELGEKLRVELPGILNWALDGLDSLKRRGRFVEPDDSAMAKRNLLYQSNPVHGFVEECCIVESGAAIDKSILYKAFDQFCRGSGLNNVKALPQVSSDLQDLYDIGVARPRVGSDRFNIFRGIRLNDRMLPHYFAVNHDLIELGFEAHEALKLDAGGWPIPRINSDADDFGP